MLVYRCDKCGACCERRIVGASVIDVLREPRIAAECPILDGHGKIPLDEADWSVACGITRACPFQNSDRSCDIYATRPDECAAFLPGAAKCQEDRHEAGLPPLEPIEVAEPTIGDRIGLSFIGAECDDLDDSPVSCSPDLLSHPEGA